MVAPAAVIPKLRYKYRIEELISLAFFYYSILEESRFGMELFTNVLLLLV